ncbi:MAG: RNA 2',3'-cyclic phosphodiesterase [Asgard group archaeon]|nr:RNA 2',3'-cyclic phosphodiesterase [Asgard group archaeon]
MTIRAFFAVEISEKNILQQIEKLQKELELPDTRINFVAPKNLHFTLKFLGNIDESIITDLEKEAKKISFEKFEIELEGVGCLPGFHYINAIYIGVKQGLSELSVIAKQLEGLSGLFNFKKENRPFKAHLTIGRLKRVGNKNQLVEKIKSFEKENLGIVDIDSFVLKKSELTPQGPIYTTVFEIESKK